jgi:chromate transport protein ChrA
LIQEKFIGRMAYIKQKELWGIRIKKFFEMFMSFFKIDAFTIGGSYAIFVKRRYL